MNREEIREGIAEELWPEIRSMWAASFWDLEYKDLSDSAQESLLAFADRVMKREHSQGVVIKVDRELPECSIIPKTTGVCPYKKAGYGAVESLIKEE